MREPKQVSRPEVIGSGREVPIDGLAVEHREHRFYPRTRRDQGRSRLWRWQFTRIVRSEEHTSELQSLMRISYAVFCLKKKTIDCKENLRLLSSSEHHMSSH